MVQSVSNWISLLNTTGGRKMRNLFHNFESEQETTQPMDKHERLQKARERAGYGSASAAAKALGVAVSTYISHENGNREFNADHAKRYARRFSVSPNWLLWGEGDINSRGQLPEPPQAIEAPFGEMYDAEAISDALELVKRFQDKSSTKLPRDEFYDAVLKLYDEIMKRRAEAP